MILLLVLSSGAPGQQTLGLGLRPKLPLGLRKLAASMYYQVLYLPIT